MRRILCNRWTGLVLILAGMRQSSAMAQRWGPVPGQPPEPSLPRAVDAAPASDVLPMPAQVPNSAAEAPVRFTPPSFAPGDRPLPINLASALKLANVRPWDVLIAGARVQVAAAAFNGSAVLWLPTLYSGVDYLHHEGGNQNLNTGQVLDISRSSFMVGTAPFAVFAVTDAIFEPLAGRQLLRAREADYQTVTNDTTLSVALAYFDVEQARGDLASAEDVVRRASQMVSRIDKMAPELVPRVEVFRARNQFERYEQGVQSARERWRVASAELARLLRLAPDALLGPVEPPHLSVTLIAPERGLEDLIAVGVTNRPELASQQALVQAALQRWRQERVRPLLPILLARGAGTQTPYPLALGAFGGGQGGSLNNFAVRSDFDVQALWELRNFGLGNLALIRGRQAEHDVAEMQLYRIRDFVAREVVQAYAQVQSAATRLRQAQRGLREALLSAKDNYEGLGKIKRVGGNIFILVIRPQEALSSVQDLNTAYTNYYGAVADYNRAQFRLYRALGNPAHLLSGPDGLASCALGGATHGPLPQPRPADGTLPTDNRR